MPDPHISEVKFLGAGNQDFVEIALDAGTDPSTIQLIVYNPSGSVRTTNDLGSADSTNAGKDVYAIDAAGSATFNGVHKNGALALVEDGVVVQFISFESTITASSGPAAGMTSTALGPTGQGESLETTDGGASYSVNETPSKGIIPCFLAGTKILTSEGARPVEDLQTGDKVVTRDHGDQTIVWVGVRQLSLNETSELKSRPIRLPAHVFGAGQPQGDTYISPNHRVLVSDPLCLRLFGVREVFVAAKFLIGFRGIGHAPAAVPIRFHHILLQNHEVISANGLATESLFNGTLAAEGFLESQPNSRSELSRFKSHDAPARRVLKAREALKLIREIEKQETFHLKFS